MYDEESARLLREKGFEIGNPCEQIIECNTGKVFPDARDES